MKDNIELRIKEIELEMERDKDQFNIWFGFIVGIITYFSILTYFVDFLKQALVGFILSLQPLCQVLAIIILLPLVSILIGRLSVELFKIFINVKVNVYDTAINKIKTIRSELEDNQKKK